MTPIFPDCYDEWGLYEDLVSEGGDRYNLIYEGTEEQCRGYAHIEYNEEERTRLFLMDWEAREWGV
jgi:hypothetical protein